MSQQSEIVQKILQNAPASYPGACQTKSAAPEGAAPFNSGSQIDQPVNAGVTGVPAAVVVVDGAVVVVVVVGGS